MISVAMRPPRPRRPTDPALYYTREPSRASGTGCRCTSAYDVAMHPRGPRPPGRRQPPADQALYRDRGPQLLQDD